MRKTALVSILSMALTVGGYGTVMARSFVDLPLSFTANAGQVNGEVLFYERGSGHSTYFTADETVLCVEEGCVELGLVNGNEAPEVVGLERQAGTVNYIIGSDPAKWRTGVPTYGKIAYREVYPGIDLEFYGKERSLEYDVVVHPGADPSPVRFAYRGAKALKKTASGGLEIVLEGGSIFQERPVAYQVVDGRRMPVEGAFLVGGEDPLSYSFEVASYDRSLPLVIDPVIIYSTYQGGDGKDYGNAIAMDGMGNVVVTGVTMSTDFPVTPSPYQGALSGLSDAFVIKLNSAGTERIFATYFGGGGNEEGFGVAVDAEGAIYLTGETSSIDFPFVAGAPLEEYSGSFDAFVTKMSSDGSALAYSTYLGGTGSDLGYDIAVDTSGQAIVTGVTASTNFPTAGSPYQNESGGTQDVFVTKVNAGGTAWLYSSYIGGSDSDQGWGLALAPDGSLHITGRTSSANFPTVGPFQASLGGMDDAFILKMNSAGSALVFSSYLGGSNRDFAADIALDSAGNSYLTGATRSTDFPTVSPLQAVNGGDYDAFVSKVNSTGSAMVYSTYLGGVDREEGDDIVVDAMGAAHLIGESNAAGFPLVRPLQSTYGGMGDATVFILDSTGGALLFSTYLGGAGIDYAEALLLGPDGSIYLTGGTQSADFPTVKPIQSALGAGYDVFVTRIDPSSYSDWNGDGMEDIVWRSYSGATSGSDNLWYLGITMGSPAVTGTAGLPSVLDTDWVIEGAPDVNGDGNPDLFWRRYGTAPGAGSNYVWYMGMTMGMHAMTGGGGLPPAGINWDVEGVPDINGDGNPDLVWRDYTTGANYVWYLATTLGDMPFVSGSAPLPAAGLNWTLDGTPDIDGDGMPDLLWRDYTTGANYVWYLGMTLGMPVYTGGAVLPGAGTAWTLDATPDANLDGKPDLLFRNYSTGANYIWYLGMTMGAPVITGTDPISGAAVDWQIEN